MNGVWTVEKAWEWYNKQPWLRGCNFMGSDCNNRIDQWQEYGFEERFTTAERELELAASTGFNTIRLIMQFEVWDQEHAGFMKRLDRYLAAAYKCGISSMICFGNDCMVPKDENYVEPALGLQKLNWGYHGNRRYSPHGPLSSPGYSVLDEEDSAQRFYKMVHEIVSEYAKDPRVVIWDIFNEPGNSRRGNMSMPHMIRFFDIAREIDPMQPLTCAPYKNMTHGRTLTEIEQKALELSDIISYHCYGNFENNIQVIENLRRYGRPLINTEWLNRITHNNVFEMFPLFYLERIGCYNWGFVAGLYQTYEPWENLWARYYKGEAKDVDFTKWQHDLYRPSLRPYDPNEIELIKKYCKYADERDGFCKKEQ